MLSTVMFLIIQFAKVTSCLVTQMLKLRYANNNFTVFLGL